MSEGPGGLQRGPRGRRWQRAGCGCSVLGAHSPPRFPPEAFCLLCCLRSAASFKSHGYHLLQTMRFALEEINNSSSLLPNVTLGYDIYDTCSESANLYATLRALVQKGQRDVGVLPALQHYEPTAVAVIGPDSTQLALTTAAILGVFLVPEVSSAPSQQQPQQVCGSQKKELQGADGVRESGLEAGSSVCSSAQPCCPPGTWLQLWSSWAQS